MLWHAQPAVAVAQLSVSCYVHKHFELSLLEAKMIDPCYDLVGAGLLPQTATWLERKELLIPTVRPQ